MPTRKYQPGCPCCSNPTGPCTWVVTVNDCVGHRSGVTVTVTQGGYSWTATTNGSGVATFASLPTGSATATASAPTARFGNGAATRTLVSGSQSNTINLTAASGYVCCGLADPIPTTLYLTDGYRSGLALTWDGSSKFVACYTETVAGVDYDYPTLSCVGNPAQTFARAYELICLGGGVFNLTCKESFVGCGNLGSLYYPCLGRCVGNSVQTWDYVVGIWGGAGNHGSPNATSSIPLNLTFNFPTGGGFSYDVGTVPVTE